MGAFDRPVTTTRPPLIGSPRITVAARRDTARAAVAELKLSDEMVDYVVDLIRATREDPRLVCGASPRASNMIATASRAWAALRGLLAAYPDRLTRRREPGSSRGRMVGGRGVRLAEESAVTEAPLFVCVAIDGREVLYDKKNFDDLVLAYAVSVHKSQGSEYPAVVMPVSTQHFKMLQRNLLYTGITRGRRLVVLVGTSKAMRIAAGRGQQTARHSRLAPRLADAVGSW